MLERHPFPNLCLTAPMSTPRFCLSQSPSTLRRLRPGPRPRRPLPSVVLASGTVRSRVLGFLVLGSVVVLGCIVSVGWLDGRTTQVTSRRLPKLCVLFLLKRKERLCCALAGARSAAERAPKCTRTKRTGSGRRGSSRAQAGSSRTGSGECTRRPRCKCLADER